MCQPAKVVDRYGEDVADTFGIPYVFNEPGPGGVYLGSVGDQDHQTRKSSHNCAPMQEDPVDGVAYHPNFAHAWDARPASKAIGEDMRMRTLLDPRVRYVIYDNVGTKPNGETWTTDHPTYHVSFLPGTHDNTAPFFDITDQPPAAYVPEEDDMILRVKGYEGHPPIYLGGLPHLVPGPFVDEYSKARKGNGIVDLKNDADGRSHYDKVAALVREAN